jgi:hypothetical protein
MSRRRRRVLPAAVCLLQARVEVTEYRLSAPDEIHAELRRQLGGALEWEPLRADRVCARVLRREN